MTITRAYLAGWGVGEKLTSAQQNALDINTTYAYDIRSGQVALVASSGDFIGAGRLRPTVYLGDDFDESFDATSAASVIRVTTAVTAPRTYTLSATGRAANDIVTVYCDPNFTGEVTVVDQAAATMFVIGNTNSSDSSWASFIYIGGWILYRHGPPNRDVVDFTIDGTTIVVPRTVTMAIAVGCGGGGGGGSGNQAVSAVDRSPTGGGGGGGAPFTTHVMVVTPGSTLTATIGTGGTGAVPASTPGSDGTASSFTDGVTVWTFEGGGGGLGGGSCDGAGNALWVPGGLQIAGYSVTNSQLPGTSATPPLLNVPAGAGGWGTSSNVPFGRAGTRSARGFAGGASGTHGATSGTYRGGGGGGGGGGGAYFAASGGGGGGAGNNAGVGGNGNAGAAGSANSGAGGGGGGGAGMGSGGTGNFGVGGNGGSGRIQLFWVK